MAVRVCSGVDYKPYSAWLMPGACIKTGDVRELTTLTGLQALILIRCAWDPGMCRERSTSLGKRTTVLRRCYL